MKVFKFELGGSHVFYSGNNLGEAIAEFVKHRPERIKDIETITEESVR